MDRETGGQTDRQMHKTNSKVLPPSQGDNKTNVIVYICKYNSVSFLWAVKRIKVGFTFVSFSLNLNLHIETKTDTAISNDINAMLCIHN